MVVRQLWPLKHSTILAEGCHAPGTSRERRYVETHCTVSSFYPDLVAYNVIEFHVLQDRGRGRRRARLLSRYCGPALHVKQIVHNCFHL